MKQLMKGFAAGFLVCAVLASVTAFGAGGVMKEIFYNGIRVVVDGKPVKFANEPFVMDGTTYLPLRNVAEALGKPVEYDPATLTAYIGNPSEEPAKIPKDGVTEDQVIDFLCEEAPEIKRYADHIERESQGQATFIIYVDGERKLNKPMTEEPGNYYMVYVGEAWDDHTVNWDWFYVRDDLSRVLWFDLIEGTAIPLEQWRESQWYRGLE